MKITSIQIETYGGPEKQILAIAKIALDGHELSGIKIMRGRYGLFLAFPKILVGEPYGVPSMRFRQAMQTEILAEYQRMMAAPPAIIPKERRET